jgi:hypothetical protein
MLIDCKLSLLGWRKLDNGELKILYFLPVINRVIRWRRVRWAPYVKRKGETSNAYKDLVGHLSGRNLMKGLGIYWRAVLMSML